MIKDSRNKKDQKKFAKNSKIKKVIERILNWYENNIEETKLILIFKNSKNYLRTINKYVTLKHQIIDENNYFMEVHSEN